MLHLYKSQYKVFSKTSTMQFNAIYRIQRKRTFYAINIPHTTYILCHASQGLMYNPRPPFLPRVNFFNEFSCNMDHDHSPTTHCVAMET